MSDPNSPKSSNIADEEPLSPEVEAVARRIRRMGMVSFGILAVGLFAVFGAILYKTQNEEQSDLLAKAQRDVDDRILLLLPQAVSPNMLNDGRVAVADDRLLVMTSGDNDGPQVLIYDLTSGELLSLAIFVPAAE